MLPRKTPQKLPTETEKLLQEYQQLLRKIARHHYGTKMLISAKKGLELIANYKPARKR